jgi:hypothetical protein
MQTFTLSANASPKAVEKKCASLVALVRPRLETLKKQRALQRRGKYDISTA